MDGHCGCHSVILVSMALISGQVTMRVSEDVSGILHTYWGAPMGSCVYEITMVACPSLKLI